MKKFLASLFALMMMLSAALADEPAMCHLHLKLCTPSG